MSLTKSLREQVPGRRAGDPGFVAGLVRERLSTAAAPGNVDTGRGTTWA